MNSYLTSLVDKMRDASVNGNELKELSSEIAKFLLYEALSDYPLEEKEVPHWQGTYNAKCIDSSRFAILPILRASLGMAEGINKMLKNSSIYHLGMYRDHETKKPVWYFNNLPDSLEGLDVIIPDPMLATGGSIIAAIKEAKKRKCNSIYILSIIAAQEGINNIKKEFPESRIYVAAIDDHLDENKYIIPGLGDAGDRIYNTK